MDTFKVIIVEDVKLELKGTEQIFRSEIPEAEVIGTAQNESELWKLFRVAEPDLLLLDLDLAVAQPLVSTSAGRFVPAILSVMCSYSRAKSSTSAFGWRY